MKETKTIGVWMDHSIANIIDLNAAKNNLSIKSKFTFNVKEEAMTKGEKHMHTKEQQLHDEYYTEIANVVIKYDNILFFGPTNAKTELFNFISKDLHFKDKKINVEPADKMTDNEKNAFVRDYYTKS